MRLSPRSNLILTFLLAGALSGCAEYMNHRDSVSLGVGNAVEGNIAIQTIDPSPPGVNDTRIAITN